MTNTLPTEQLPLMLSLSKQQGSSAHRGAGRTNDRPARGRTHDQSETFGPYGNNWPALMSIAVAAGLPILVIFHISYRRLRAGLALGSAR